MDILRPLVCIAGKVTNFFSFPQIFFERRAAGGSLKPTVPTKNAAKAAPPKTKISGGTAGDMAKFYGIFFGVPCGCG